MNQLSLLDAITAAPPVRPSNISTWDGYILEARTEVGKVGPRWQQGGKCHRVYTKWIIGYEDGYTPKPGHMKIGDCFSAHTPCNSNGQHIAHSVAGWTDDMINCAKCVKTVR